MLINNEVAERESQELMSLINRVDNYLNTKKTRIILNKEITTQTIEIGFIKDRFIILLKQLDDKAKEITVKKPILIDLKDKLSLLEPKLKSEEVQYLKLKEMQDKIEDKQRIIEERRIKTNHLNTEIESLSLTLDKLNKDYEAALNRKKEIEIEKNTFESQKHSLIEDIKVMKNTDDLLKGLIPDGLDAHTFSGVVNNIETLVKKYVSEINFTIETIERDVSSKKFEIANKDKERESLLDQKEELLEEIKSLESFRITDDQRETALAEINQLREKANEISGIIEKKEIDVQHSDYELMGIEETLKIEKDFESFYFDRYTYLNQLKKDISQLKDVNREMERLKDDTKLLKVKEEINKKALDETAAVLDEAVNINNILNSKITQYKALFDELNGILKGQQS